MEKFLESIGAVTEMVALYYTCLVKAGLPSDAALALTIVFQGSFLNKVNKRIEEQEEAE